MKPWTAIWALAVVAVLCWSGCAARSGVSEQETPTTVQDPAQEVEALERRIQAHEIELGGTLEASAAPNCHRARALAGSICELAERICRIADRNREDRRLGERCEDAKRRCEKARVTIAVRCAAQP